MDPIAVNTRGTTHHIGASSTLLSNIDSSDVQKKALKGYERGETPITCRPAEVLEPELPKAEEDVKGLAVDLDDKLIYALYPVTGKKFLKWKYGKE